MTASIARCCKKSSAPMSGSLGPCEHLPKSIPSAVSSGALCTDHLSFPEIASERIRAISEPIREVLESDESDAIHCCALDSLAERAMWEPEHRLAGLRYLSDLTDAEWAIVAPTIPPGRNGGRRRSVNVRDVLTGSSTCCGPAGQWKGAAQESAAEEHGARPSRRTSQVDCQQNRLRNGRSQTRL
jgi:hypothetical protein